MEVKTFAFIQKSRIKFQNTFKKNKSPGFRSSSSGHRHSTINHFLSLCQQSWYCYQGYLSWRTVPESGIAVYASDAYRTLERTRKNSKTQGSGIKIKSHVGGYMRDCHWPVWKQLLFLPEAGLSTLFAEGNHSSNSFHKPAEKVCQWET